MSEQNNNLPNWFKEHVPLDISNSSLFYFKIKLRNGTEIVINLLDDIDINFEILEEQHERIPAQYIYWAAVYSELRCSVTTLELKIRSKRHAIVRRTIEEFKNRSMKPTDKQTTIILDGDQDLIKLEAELAIIQKNVGKVYHMVEAIKLRSEHSRSLAGFKRQEKEQSGRQT
jgi:hypothetical protein